jgi:hypothetical protein
VHDVLRPQIFANAGFSAKPDLWVLQTILLVECFGKSRAGQKQHDMSHLFHGLLINLIRRSDCQSIIPPTAQDATHDLEDDWRTWVDAEQKKRYTANDLKYITPLTNADLPFFASCGTRSTQSCSVNRFACPPLSSAPTCRATSHCGRPTQQRHGISCARTSLLRRCSCHV